MLALVLLFSSAFNPVETGLKEGKQAPMLKLKNSEGAVTLSELKGRYVLLNFWAGYDAPSRMENIRFAREIDKNKIENISYLISPEGVIIAKDPNPEQLTKLIRQ